MMLFTYSFENQQNFKSFQDELKLCFGENFQANCKDFNESGRKENEMSLLFIEDEIKIFYSVPRCDECDCIHLDKPINLEETLFNIYNFFEGNIDLSAHISYNDNHCPVKHIFHYLPEPWKDDSECMLEFLQTNQDNIACSVHVSPQTSKEILFTVHTFDMDKSSIFNVIDGTSKTDFIPRFFTLVSVLYRR